MTLLKNNMVKCVTNHCSLQHTLNGQKSPKQNKTTTQLKNPKFC